jgi:hypothetical protein
VIRLDRLCDNSLDPNPKLISSVSASIADKQRLHHGLLSHESVRTCDQSSQGHLVLLAKEQSTSNSCELNVKDCEWKRSRTRSDLIDPTSIVDSISNVIRRIKKRESTRKIGDEP